MHVYVYICIYLASSHYVSCMRNYVTRKTVLYKYVHEINKSCDNKVIALRFVSVVVTIVKREQKEEKKIEKRGRGETHRWTHCTDSKDRENRDIPDSGSIKFKQQQRKQSRKVHCLATIVPRFPIRSVLRSDISDISVMIDASLIITLSQLIPVKSARVILKQQ